MFCFLRLYFINPPKRGRTSGHCAVEINYIPERGQTLTRSPIADWRWFISKNVKNWSLGARLIGLEVLLPCPKFPDKF
jgi:hypothetical protein